MSADQTPGSVATLDGNHDGSPQPGVGAALGSPEPATETKGAAQGPTGQTAGNVAEGDGIAGKSVLQGLVVYAAVLAFAGLYVDFIIIISKAKPNTTASIDTALITAAAALAGVLGSAFALRVGNPAPQTLINQALKTRIDNVNDPETETSRTDRVKRIVHEALSLGVSAPNKPSWPITVGIWVYAIVGSAVAITYALNEHETPGTVKALAVTFAGYVIALLSVAFGVKSSDSTGAKSS